MILFMMNYLRNLKNTMMKNNEDKVLSLLGLLMKGRNIVSGEDTVLNELKKERLSLVIIAGDASGNTKKRFNDKAKYRDVPVIEISTKEKLGRSIGKEYRSVIGIMDKKAAKSLLSYVE